MIAAVLLAAGGSARLGQPKQLLRFRGGSLVRRAAEAALAGGCAPLVTVTGAHHDAVCAELGGIAAKPIFNQGWSDGVAGSIRLGVQHVVSATRPIRAVVLLACDQPALDAAVVERLIAAFDGRAGRRVACAYGGTVGVPALFERSLFERLTTLEGDRGAKGLLLEEPRLLIRLPWPEGGRDVNRPDDLARLN